MLLVLLAACPAPEDSAAEPVGALGKGRQNPFPSVELVGADGHLALEAGDLPVKEDGAPWDFATFAAREGFSVVQPSVVQFDVPLDPERIGGQASVATDGVVRMVDLDTGEALWCFAELDAAPEALATGLRPLIVRPMQTLTPGHRIAVVVTSGVTSGGEPLDLPAPEGHYADLHEELAAIGQTDVVLAWDFPVARGNALLDATLAATRAVPGAPTWTREWDADVEGSEPPAGLWRLAQGTFQPVNLLFDENHMELDADGVPAVNGTVDAYLMVAVPEAVRDAAPGTVPVLLFGHGILSDPSDYLRTDDDTSGVVAFANEMGAIVVATEWTGLGGDDRLHAIDVAGDFTRFDEMPQMLAQGVANNVALLAAVRDGGLLDEPIFGGLADPTRIAYYGISLGGIEGAVMLTHQDVVSRGVLHVGGAAWATMLERSAQWPPFDIILTRNFPDPFDRQVLYAASQVLWDPVDPATYAEELAAGSFLWQESIGDEQVPNLTTELLARSTGATLGEPNVTSPAGLPSAPMPFTGLGVTQFDPEEPLPEPVNRPGTLTGAHSIPRTWEGSRAQAIHFLRTGEVAHYCGTEPCSASNPGSF
jgi:hypothetical protein